MQLFKSCENEEWKHTCIYLLPALQMMLSSVPHLPFPIIPGIWFLIEK